MGDIVVFSQQRGVERVWVPGGEESAWVRRFQRWGTPAATLADYRRWRGFWPRPAGSADVVTLRKPTRRRTNYARWRGY